MEKEEIRDYLEDKLNSSPDNIFDNNDRLVLISDVSNVVFELMKEYIKLDKSDLISLVKGCEPSYSLIDELSAKNYGYWCGGMVDEWRWNEFELKKLDNEELWNIYQKCKNS
jgi:hypothetical protein